MEKHPSEIEGLETLEMRFLFYIIMIKRVKLRPLLCCEYLKSKVKLSSFQSIFSSYTSLLSFEYIQQAAEQVHAAK